MTGGVSGSGLPWFKLYVDIFDHPKCEELGHELGAEDAWRYVVKLYGRVAKFRADGDLSGWTNGRIARVAGWSGDPDLFVGALTEVGLLDDQKSVHDWEECQGAHVRKVLKDREKRKNPRGTLAEPSRVLPKPPEGSSKPPGGRGEERRGDERRLEKREKKKQAAKRPAPDHFDRLLAQEWQGHPTARDAFAAEFPAFDGRNGRMSLEAKLEDLRDWYTRAAPSKRWTSPAGIQKCLARDYPQAKRDHERDQQQGLVGLPDPNKQGLSKEEIDRRHAEKVRRHQEAKKRGAGNG